jgi:hypothetical protein
LHCVNKLEPLSPASLIFGRVSQEPVVCTLKVLRSSVSDAPNCGVTYDHN